MVNRPKPRSLKFLCSAPSRLLICCVMLGRILNLSEPCDTAGNMKSLDWVDLKPPPAPICCDVPCPSLFHPLPHSLSLTHRHTHTHTHTHQSQRSNPRERQSLGQLSPETSGNCNEPAACIWPTVLGTERASLPRSTKGPGLDKRTAPCSVS